MKLTHIVLILAVLIGTDLFIGFYGHYVGRNNETVPTFDSFVAYIQCPEVQSQLWVIMVVAIGVVFVIRYILKKG